MRKFCLAIAAVVLLTGAKATIGEDFDAANVSKLQVGQTTLPQAVELLGAEPQSSTVGKSGAIAYGWSHVLAKSSMWSGKTSAESKRVVLVFSTDGTFQRILQLSGVQLADADRARLMVEPARESRQLVHEKSER
ncbi:MAG: hypothetical protein ACREPD_04710 [Stenotrophomonas sp.]|uniref:hypothetical protein n=1 Tax=Stenotrophomonas sp. TaxID=69392 RepID=UPI003D6D257D